MLTSPSRQAPRPTAPGRGAFARCALLAGALSMLLGGGWPDASTPPRTGAKAPRDAAVILSVEHYATLPGVPYAIRDGESAYHWLTTSQGVPARQIQRLQDPTGQALITAIAEGAKEVEEGGTLWIFYSGHGALLPSTGLHHLLGRDDTLQQASGPALEELAPALATTAAGRVLLVVDAGFTGFGRDATPLDEAVSIADSALPAPDDPRVVIWTAASPSEIAGPLEATRNGLFTWHVLGALKGWADGVVGEPDGQLTLEEAQLWVAKRFEALDRGQHPQIDPRPAARAWSLGKAWREAPADLAQLEPGAPPKLPEVYFAGDPSEDEDTLPLDEVEAELRKQFQENADEDWSIAYSAASSKHPEARHLLERFLARYAGWTFLWQGHLFTMSASQVPQARRLLGQGAEVTGSLIRSVRVSKGTATLGSPAGSVGRRPDETLHTARITHDLEVSEVEITQEVWTTVTGTAPSARSGRYLPVERVSWREAVLFCNALSRLDGYDPVYEVRSGRVTWDQSKDGWRLPTEAEWTLLTDGGLFPDHDEVEQACRTANIADAGLGSPPSGPLGRYTCEDGSEATSTVRALRPSARGIYGLGGNVAEWTWDAYAPLTGEDSVDPAPDKPSATRLVKGGSFRTPPHAARTAARRPLGWDERADDVGLRVVRTAR